MTELWQVVAASGLTVAALTVAALVVLFVSRKLRPVAPAMVPRLGCGTCARTERAEHEHDWYWCRGAEAKERFRIVVPTGTAERSKVAAGRLLVAADHICRAYHSRREQQIVEEEDPDDDEE